MPLPLELYTVLQKLIFAEYITVPPGSYLSVEYENDLAHITAMQRTGTILGENTVYYKTINIWKDSKNIVPSTYNDHTVYGGVMGFDEGDYVPPEYRFNYIEDHGCNVAVVAMLNSVYTSPTVRDPYKLIRNLYNAVKTNEDYWVLHGPEPLLKRLASSIAAKGTRLAYNNVENLIKSLTQANPTVTIAYQNVRRSQLCPK